MRVQDTFPHLQEALQKLTQHLQRPQTSSPQFYLSPEEPPRIHGEKESPGLHLTIITVQQCQYCRPPKDWTDTVSLHLCKVLHLFSQGLS